MGSWEGDGRTRLKDFKLYTIDSPPYYDYSSHNRKTSIQYEANLLLKPAIKIGSKQRFEIYEITGLTLLRAYGKDFNSHFTALHLGIGCVYTLRP